MGQINLRNDTDTIAAIATPHGVGGISVIRVSGPDARRIVNDAWRGPDLTTVKTHTAHFGRYLSTSGEILDEGLATVFISPASFTGEDSVEISTHGSKWIQREVLNDLIRRGARMATPGEFTQRAFMNGKIDLSQAEGIADLIASTSKAAHDMAMNQTRGAFAKEFNQLREQLIELSSLMELELDFSEEDVEFADRTRLLNLCEEIAGKVKKSADSFSRGAVLKDGVPVVIAGIPNAGKSSLLNLLLNDEKAIVTDIPGTTRDIIEDTAEIEGVLYRFIDTAGLRDTADKVEGIGVDRARAALEKAFIVIWIIDFSAELEPQLAELNSFRNQSPSPPVIILLNKTDIYFPDLQDGDPLPPHKQEDFLQQVDTLLFPLLKGDLEETIPFSTKTALGLKELLTALKEHSQGDSNPETDLIVTNARHYEALTNAATALNRVKEGLSTSLPTDLLAQDLREALHHLSLITGSITTDTLLSSIFSKFCIGK